MFMSFCINKLLCVCVNSLLKYYFYTTNIWILISKLRLQSTFGFEKEGGRNDSVEEKIFWYESGSVFPGFHSLAFIQNIFLSFDPLLKDLLKDLAVGEIHTPDEGV